MKKVSLSLFGILAIAIAITSAFTTSPKANAYKVWGLQQDQVSISETSIGTIESKVQATLYDESSPLSFSGSDASKLAQFVDEFNTNNPLEAIQCNTETSKMCLAYVNDATSPETPQILAVRDGDFAQ